MTNDPYERDPGQEVPRQRLGLIDFATQNIERAVTAMTPVQPAEALAPVVDLDAYRRDKAARQVSAMNVKSDYVAHAQEQVEKALNTGDSDQITEQVA